MATLALSAAGQFVGGAFGGPIGATLGRALGALAGSAIDSTLFGDGRQTPPGADIRIQGSSEGAPVPRLYGWGRLAGNIIWATELEDYAAESTGAKALSEEPETGVAASFAVALCEGEVQRLGRVWADGQVLETDGLLIRFYRGTEDQLPDSLIEAKQGTGMAPAYRGLCYIVFERLPLAQFGNRLPQISVELCRVVGDLEPAVRAVAVIPGATEFGYDPAPRLRLIGPGATRGENTHVSSEVSDWTLSLDELQALCPNLTHVALVVAWFGNDLRCGHCSIAPRIEAVDRVVEGVDWGVAGLTRGAAAVVSSIAGGPAYGGTPSDASVLAAIADLKARGLKVTLYPFVMMDIAPGNGLPDPHGGTEQAAYPWRGRITCMPAPGRAGSPDGSAAVETGVAAFMGGPGDWGYRRMVLHYAGLAAAAGGIDAFLIGSELRGLTSLRGVGNGFPFVAALVGLASEVRALVGPDTRLTYGADWSEYWGCQTGLPGERFFHLDPLWASSDIDAVGIDAYMPLADWRDGTDHHDAVAPGGVYGLDYLGGNIAGGEGYDWYYASPADRLAGTRTPITDGAGEPWIWRYKDIVSWWAEPHHDRPGGVRAATPTSWVPGSKPIWFTELGCPAIDKGANQPNVFGDAKSAEDAQPYFSSGGPDGLIQRQVLRAHMRHWRPEAEGFNTEHNPEATLYAGRMLDPERLYLWAWDARPYPAFPAQTDVWADGVNHARGHWLTGRLGTMASDEALAAIAADCGIALVKAAPAPPLIHGLVLDAPASARDAMTAITSGSGLWLSDAADGIVIGRTGTVASELGSDGLVAASETPLLTHRSPDLSEAVGRLGFSYVDRERDYLRGAVTALRRTQGATRTDASPLVLDLPGARVAAERMLSEHRATGDTISFALPPSCLALEPGDVVAIDGSTRELYQITTIRDGLARRVEGRALAPAEAIVTTAGRPHAFAAPVAARARPELFLALLPPPTDDVGRPRLLVAAHADPWPGVVTVLDDGSGAELARLHRRASMGQLAAPLAPAPNHLWDDASVLEVDMYGGHLSSADPVRVLAGANRICVECDSGNWEVLAFCEATLIGPGRYRLRHLLRGLDGTEHAGGAAAVGRRAVLLDACVAYHPVGSQGLGETVHLTAHAGHRDTEGQAASLATSFEPALPLAPGHVRAVESGDDITLSWTRRSRADNQGWGAMDCPLEHVPELYRVSILDGGLPIRVFDCPSTSATYTLAQQVADFGAAADTLTFRVAQVSPVLGPGHSSSGAFNG